MNQNQVLTEANRLVQSGLRKAAIALLIEYLQSHPHSPKVLSAIGRAYLLDKQARKAVFYLKQSLEISQRLATPDQQNDYDSDKFGEDDMAFVNAQSESNTDSRFEFEEEIDVTGSQSDPAFRASKPECHLDIEVSEADELPGDGESAPAAPTLQNTESAEQVVSKGSPSMDFENPAFVQVDGPCEVDDYKLDVVNSSQAEGLLDKSLHPPLVDEVPHLDSPTPITTGITDDDDIWDEDSDAWVEDDKEGIEVLDDDLSYDESYEINLSDEDEVQGREHEYDGVYDHLLEDEFDDLNPDDWEELDDFDESVNRGIDPADDLDVVTRVQRAKQVAVQVLAEAGWDHRFLPLLEEIFLRNGWSASRRAIDAAIQKGLTPDELSLARDVRGLWEESDRYWITFHKIHSNSDSNQADAAYKHMSWVEAIRLIRSYPDIPTIEEIYDFIEESYQQWYDSDQLRHVFKAFFKFLQYKTRLRRTTQAHFPLSMSDALLEDYENQLDTLCHSSNPKLRMLQALGISLNNWPKPSECKIKLLPEYREDSPSPPLRKISQEQSQQFTNQKNATNTLNPATNFYKSFGFGSSR